MSTKNLTLTDTQVAELTKLLTASNYAPSKAIGEWTRNNFNSPPFMRCDKCQNSNGLYGHIIHMFLKHDIGYAYTLKKHMQLV